MDVMHRVAIGTQKAPQSTRKNKSTNTPAIILSKTVAAGRGRILRSRETVRSLLKAAIK
jgi:hypothetical protein